MESSEFIEPISVADEVQSNDVLSNEDLQTVAPSVVNKNQDKTVRKNFQAIQRSKHTNTTRDRNMTQLPN